MKSSSSSRAPRGGADAGSSLSGVGPPGVN